MKQVYTRPEIWAGIECTINRLASGYIDQLALNGHYDRDDDLDAIAGLGITTLRYPVLWEKHQPQKHQKPDFTWAASRLERLKQLQIKPIVGLVHHGSGPEYTNLLDPDFPELLAGYAKEVATAFPWVEMWTPVNEPLTTARFSGLYGIWYPHETNDVSFIKMLLHQLKGVVLAMREIRKINPDAKLVQTEDLGKTYSTPLLKYQADMENRRRWLTYDILCGKFTAKHRFWKNFVRLGIPTEEMEFFLQNPCPPDIIGVNHYVTSERYLDQNVRKYPKHTRGGNTIHNYADVEAIRIKLKVPSGFSVLVKELWKRYKLPIAVTEAHLHCSREEQMKWFREIYNASSQLCQQGVDIRAVTAWSVLGAYGWNKLLTVDNGDYERGTFDVSSGKRRPTAMVKMLKQLSETGTYNSHLLDTDGWWKRQNRYFGNKTKVWECDPGRCTGQTLVIIGKTGTLGKAFSRICNIRGLHYMLLGREDIDIGNSHDINVVLEKHNPWAVVNAAGYVRVDDAENDHEKCFRENTLGAELLAKSCNRYGIPFMTFSSDLVFDGKKAAPYVESDAVNPLNIYGKSKVAAESAVLAAHEQSLVIRTSAFFGPWDNYNFVNAVLDTLEQGSVFRATTDTISPTYVPHLVNAALDLIIDGETGIWHLANQGEITWFDLAVEVARRAGMDVSLIEKHDPVLPASRPGYTALRSEKGILMPTLNDGLEAYFSEVMSGGKKVVHI